MPTASKQKPTQETKADEREVESFLSSLLNSVNKDKVVPGAKDLGVELFSILAGNSDLEANKRDWRFKDDAWKENPAYKRLGQSYLAFDNYLNSLVDKDADWRSRERAKFITGVVSSTFAPTNTLIGNPSALKEAFNTRGKSLLRGLNHFVGDIKNNKGMPSMVDASSFKKGENLAATPGSVIFRNDVLELIQYQPTTSKVNETPLLLVPPQINKYYFVDLSPGRSMIEYLVGEGFQPFVVSWKNPAAENADWNLSTYVSALYEAVDAMLHITKSEKFNSLGFCAGGITLSVLLAHMALKGDDRCNAFSNCVTLLDWSTPGMVGMLQDKNLLKTAKKRSEKKGVISGQELGSLFAWVRPNELVWNYWVNNYLMGKKPPSFDILAWNTDSTNLPAALHGQFLDLFESNGLTKAGGVEVLGEPVDLSKILTDSYIVGGITDHLTPWYQCYRSALLYGSKKCEFVLSDGGHIVTIVNPVNNTKSGYFKGGKLVKDPEAWREGAKRQEGSWWTDYAQWLKGRSGEEKNAPKKTGNRKYKELVAAPGEYING